MKTLFALSAIVLALLLFTPDSHQYEGEEDVEEAIRILQELENRGLDDADANDDADLDRREEEDLELRDLNCEGLCNPQDECDCVIDDCVPDDCDTSRGIQTKLRSMDNPSKKFWGRRTRGRRIAGRICRGITRFRFCRVIGK